MTEVSGQQMLWVAQGWLIYELSGSAILLGVAGLARAIPSTILSFVGGALADKLDQRKLLIAVQFIQMSLLATMATITVTGLVEVWHLMLIVSASAASQSFENPARQAIFPRLVPRDALMDAVALNSIVHPATRFFGPFLGGILMAQVRIATDSPLLGAATLFYITAAGYVLNAAFLYSIHMPAVEARRKKTSILADMRQGVKMVWGTPVFAALIAMTYCGQFFGWSFQSLFPIFAKDVFHGGEFELGLMYSTLGAGSLIGAMASSNLSGVKRRGRLIIGGFIVQASVLGFVAIAPSFAFALGVLVLVGISQAIFNVTSQSTLQYLVANEYRGRVMGIWGMTHTTVAPLGQLQMGSVAAAFSAPGAVIFGAAAMIAFALLLVLPNRHIRELRLDVNQPRGDPDGVENRNALAGARH